ncbi:MAG: hypothetical protein JRJ87_03505 [Deltaproteobacteria bacterium]|nr:hypothetical protein [Deltaproteobacteria bacterium]
MSISKLIYYFLLGTGLLCVWSIPAEAQWDDEGDYVEGDVYTEDEETDASEEQGYFIVDEDQEEFNEGDQAPVEEVEDESYFFDKLSPYGEWVWTPEHGWVWHPSGVWDDWRPYTYGRWVNTQHGWTWSSYFQWGWAPFHYGTWAFLDYVGWVWVPGTVWAPAWVVWRHSDVHIGWAPMLAGYDLWFGWAYYPIYYSHWTFTRWRYFCDPHPHHHYLGRRAIAKTFRHTYYPRRCRDNASASCHRGPSKRLVTKRTNSPVKSYRIENMASRGKILSGNTAKKLGVGGDTLKMYRPKFKNAKTKVKARSAFKGRHRKTIDFGIVHDKVRTYSPGKASKSIHSPDKFYPSSSSSTSGHAKGVRRPSPGRAIHPRQPKAKRPSIPKSSVHYPGSRTKGFKGSKFKAPSVRSKTPKRSFKVPKSKSRPRYKPSSKSSKSRSTPTYKPSKSKSSSKSKSRSSFRSSGKRSSSSSSRSKSSGSRSSKGSRRGRR